MPKPDHRRQPLAVLAVLGLAGACALGAAVIAAGDWQSSPDMIITADGVSPVRASATRTAKALQLDLVPAALTSRSSSPDAPPLPARRAQRSRTPARAEPAVRVSAPRPAVAALTPAPTVLAAAAPAKDAKLCRSPTPPLDIAHAVKAESLKLSYAPKLDGRPLDIPPPSPPARQEQQGVRLSALLGEALTQ